MSDSFPENFDSENPGEKKPSESGHPHPRKRGPKPKPPRACVTCGQFRGIEARDLCSRCNYAWKRDNIPGWFEKQSDRAANWRRNHPGHSPAKSSKPKDKIKTNVQQRLRRYGLRLEDYQELMRAQEGKCAICKAYPSASRALAIDHCHTTGKVRGLLCGSCNMGLGKFSDDPERLKVAAEYLKKT